MSSFLETDVSILVLKCKGLAFFDTHSSLVSTLNQFKIRHLFVDEAPKILGVESVDLAEVVTRWAWLLAEATLVRGLI